MASSGSFNTTGYDGRYLTFAWSEKSQSVSNNETVINWSLKGAGSGGVDWYKAGPFKVVIAGVTVYNSSTRIKLFNGTTVASGTATIKHNNDGTKSFSASVEAAIYYSAVNCKGSKTFTLDPIARASQPSLITWPETTNDVGYFGDTISIHMNRKSDAFTHTVRYEFGTKSGTIATKVETGTTWKIPESFMDLLPAATQGSGRIYVDTYNGSTLVGTKYTGFTAKVPASVKPSCSIQVLEGTSYKTTYGDLIKGLSTLVINTTGTKAYSSDIASYNVTADGIKYTGAKVTTAPISKAGTVTVTATVTDKRGRTSEPATAEFAVLDYKPPIIKDVRVRRCDEDGTANDQGEYAEIIFSASAEPLNNKNNVNYYMDAKLTSITEYTTLLSGQLNQYNGYTLTDYSYIFPFNGNKSYNVRIRVQDGINTVMYTTSVSTAFTLINWGADGTSISFGEVATDAKTFKNALALNQKGNRYAFSSPGVAGTAGFVLMANITITAANADTPITFVFTSRDAMTPMTVHVTLENSDMTASSLQSIRYEGTNYDAYLVPSGSLAWELYVKKSGNHDTITLQDWYTSKTMQNRVSVTFPGTLVSQVPTPYYKATPAALDSLIDFIYPVGSVYISYSHNNPADMFGGTWVRIENAFLWGVDDKGTIGTTGGEKTHALTVNELPKHTHGSVYSGNASGTKNYSWLASGGSNMAYGTIETGGGTAHNNMPPYVQVSIWRRTA